MESPCLGRLDRIRIGHDNSGFGPGWFLDKVGFVHVLFKYCLRKNATVLCMMSFDMLPFSMLMLQKKSTYCHHFSSALLFHTKLL